MKGVALAMLLAVASPVLAAPAGPDIRTLQAKAQTGDAEAQFQLAEAYRFGRGVTADPETAIMWYRRAAAQGHVRAGEELGFALFAHGDRHEAMPYIEKAAARGEPRAFYLLGTAHFNGDYATRDWPLAYAQTSRAASAGLAAAQRNLELMDHYLLPSDRAKADQILATLPPVRKRDGADGVPGNPTPVAAQATRPAPPAPVQTAAAAPAPKPAPAAAKTPPAKPVSGAGGNWKVQLGAFGSADRAQERWKSISAKVPRLRRLEETVVAAGSIQRLQASNIASKADAESLCKDVRAAGGDCLVMAP